MKPTATSRSRTPENRAEAFTIRMAVSADATALSRLAQLDSGVAARARAGAGRRGRRRAARRAPTRRRIRARRSNGAERGREPTHTELRSRQRLRRRTVALAPALRPGGPGQAARRERRPVRGPPPPPRRLGHPGRAAKRRRNSARRRAHRCLRALGRARHAKRERVAGHAPGAAARLTVTAAAPRACCEARQCQAEACAMAELADHVQTVRGGQSSTIPPSSIPLITIPRS
jgi:hypothetical protein